MLSIRYDFNELRVSTSTSSSSSVLFFIVFRFALTSLFLFYRKIYDVGNFVFVNGGGAQWDFFTLLYPTVPYRIICILRVGFVCSHEFLKRLSVAGFCFVWILFGLRVKVVC